MNTTSSVEQKYIRKILNQTFCGGSGNYVLDKRAIYRAFDEVFASYRTELSSMWAYLIAFEDGSDILQKDTLEERFLLCALYKNTDLGEVVDILDGYIKSYIYMFRDLRSDGIIEYVNDYEVEL